MFAVIELPDFPLQALLRMEPARRQQAVVLLDGEGRRALVAQVHAGVEGVKPGMTAGQALAANPAACFVPRSPAAEREADALLLATCWSLSPAVEATAPGRCTIDLRGAERAKLPERLQAVRERLAAQALAARVGFAANPSIARFAAHVAAPECWVDDERTFLAALPIELLPLAPDEAQFMADLGLRTFGALTGLPRAALNHRLGPRGETLWALAAGEWTGTLRPAPFPTRFLAETELAEPVETLDPLLFVLRRQAERLAAEVAATGLGVHRLVLRLRLENEQIYARSFDLPEPAGSVEALFAVLEHHLGALRTEAAIAALSLEAFPARRREEQAGLFDTGLTDAPAFFATLGRLSAVAGNENVGTPRQADTHRPDAIVLAPPASSVPERQAPGGPEPHGPLLRRLRPPPVATVELTDARPSFVVSSLVQGEVTVLRRPFRADGGWFDRQAWALEEWDVRIADGLYRLRHEPAGWSIEGIYD